MIRDEFAAVIQEAEAGHQFDLGQLELQKRQSMRHQKRRNEDEKQKLDNNLLSTIIIAPPVTADGVYLGMYRKSMRDPTQLFDGYSTLLSFPLNHPIRRRIIDIVDSLEFDCFILGCIVYNSILLAIDSPTATLSRGVTTWLRVSDAVLLAVYSIEAALKMVASGLLFNGPFSYLRDSWNILDLSVVLLGYLALIPGVNSKFGGLRAVRVLRPLRSVHSVRGMQLLIVSLLRSLRMMVNVLLLCCFVFVFFGLVSLQLFAGKLRQRCHIWDDSSEEWLLADTEDPRACGFRECDEGQSCRLAPASDNPNGGVTSFDNIGAAFVAVMQEISLEGWSEIAYRTMESVGPWTILFHLALITVGSYVVANLVVGVIVSAYDQEFQKAKERDLLEKRTHQRNHQTFSNVVRFAVKLKRMATESLSRTVSHSNLRLKRDQSQQEEIIDLNKEAPTITDGENRDENEDAGDNEEEEDDSVFISLKKTQSENKLQRRATGFFRGNPLSEQQPRDQQAESPLISPLNRTDSFETEMDGMNAVSSALRRSSDGRGDQTALTVDTTAEIPVDGAITNTSVVSATNASTTQILTKRPSMTVYQSPSHRFHRTLKNKRRDMSALNKIQTMITEKWLLPLCQLCFKISESSMFNNAMMSLILVNTALLASVHFDQPQSYSTFLDAANLVFTGVFTFECAVRLLGYGVWQYFSDAFNRFDFAVVTANLVDIGMQQWLGTGAVSGLTAFRAFRILKVFRLARKWRSLRTLLRTILLSLGSLFHFTLVLLLFVFIYALLGQQIFAGKLKSESRMHFDNFYWSVVSVFQVMGGENWNEIFYVAYRKRGPFLSTVYFISLFVLGNYVMLNLFLAILLSNFEQSNDDEDQIDDHRRRRSNHGSSGGDNNKDDSTSASASMSSSKTSSSMAGIIKAIAEGKHRRHSLAYEGRPRLLLEHPNKTWKQWFLQLFRADNLRDLHSMDERTLFIFTKQHSLRRFSVNVVSRPQFEMFVLVCIAVSSVVLIFDEPKQSSHTRRVLWWINLSSLCVFYCEASLRIIAVGLIQTERAYLKDKWNYVDMAALLFGTLDLILDNGDVAFLKVVRALRALRVIRRIEGMRVVSLALFHSLKPVLNVCAVACLFFLVFGILGITLYCGQFYQCTHQTDGSILYGINRDECESQGFKWANPSFGHFDHIGGALVLLFEISTLEGWPDVMNRAVDIAGVDKGPIRDNQPAQALFFVAFVIVTNFFVMNLFVGVVIDHFNQAKLKLEGVGYLTDSQNQWVLVKKLLCQRTANDVGSNSSSSSGSEALFLRPPRLSDDFHQRLELGGGNHNSSNLICNTEYMWFRIRCLCFDIIIHPKFEALISLLIVLNVVVMATVHFDQSRDWTMIQTISNRTFTILFALESTVKLMALSFEQYFASLWNSFDFVIVCGSILTISMSESQFDLTILRLFRVLRLLRLVKRARGLQILLRTLVYSVPSLSNIGLLLGLMFFVFGVIGMGLLGDDDFDLNSDYSSQVNEHANFRTFLSSVLTLLRCATGESWNALMRDYYHSSHTILGRMAIIVFFFVFVILVSFIVVNLFVAIIIEQFDAVMDENRRKTALVRSEDVSELMERFSESAEGRKRWWLPLNDDHLWMDALKLEVMLLHCPGMLGLKTKPWSRGHRWLFLTRKLSKVLPLHRRKNAAGEWCWCVNAYELCLALAFQVFADSHLNMNESELDKELTQDERFLRLSVHRKIDWQIARHLQKQQRSNQDCEERMSLRELLAAQAIQASWRGYSLRKVLRIRLANQ